MAKQAKRPIKPKKLPAPPPPIPNAAERLRQIAEEQGTTHTSKWENMLGVGEDWWTDEEFEEFQAWLRKSRGHE